MVGDNRGLMAKHASRSSTYTDARSAGCIGAACVASCPCLGRSTPSFDGVTLSIMRLSSLHKALQYLL